jgi:hypothetical protein
MAVAAFVPGYSGGTAVASHHFPFCISSRRRPASSSIELSTAAPRHRASEVLLSVSKHRSLSRPSLGISMGCAEQVHKQNGGRVISPRRDPFRHFTAATRWGRPPGIAGPSPDAAIPRKGCPSKLLRQIGLFAWPAVYPGTWMAPAFDPRVFTGWGGTRPASGFHPAHEVINRCARPKPESADKLCPRATTYGTRRCDG